MTLYHKNARSNQLTSYLHTYMLTLTLLYHPYIACHSIQVARNNDSATISRNTPHSQYTLLTLDSFMVKRRTSTIYTYPYHSLSYLCIFIQWAQIGAYIISLIDHPVGKLSKNLILDVILNCKKILLDGQASEGSNKTPQMLSYV